MEGKSTRSDREGALNVGICENLVDNEEEYPMGMCLMDGTEALLDSLSSLACHIILGFNRLALLAQLHRFELERQHLGERVEEPLLPVGACGSALLVDRSRPGWAQALRCAHAHLGAIETEAGEERVYQPVVSV